MFFLGEMGFVYGEMDSIAVFRWFIYLLVHLYRCGEEECNEAVVNPVG